MTQLDHTQRGRVAATAHPEAAPEPPVARNTREIGRMLFPSEKEFLKLLDLTPRELALFSSDITRSGIREDFFNALIIAEYAGVPLHQAYLAANSSFLSHEGNGSIRHYIQTSKQYIRAVIPEHGDACTPAVQPFDAVLREVSVLALPANIDKSFQSTALLLQLPEPEWEHLLRHCRTAPFQTANALAILRLIHREDNQIEVLEITSDVYDYIKDQQLKEKYRDWKHLLMRGLLDYAAHSIPHHADPNGFITAGGNDTPRSVEIVIPSPAQMLSVYRARDARSHWGSIAHYEDQYDPYKAKYKTPGLTEENANYNYRELPLQYGFSLNTPDLEMTELKEHFKEALTRTVPFVGRGGGRQDPLFKLLHRSRRLTRWIEIADSSFNHVAYTMVPAEPYPLSHRIKPVVPDYLKEAHAALQSGAELAPSLRFPEERMSCATELRLARFAELREHLPAYAVFRSLVPENFTVISRGLSHGAQAEWWRLPDAEDAQITAQFIHLKDQNRHPSLRLIDTSQPDNPILIGSYSFKGGGVASVEGIDVATPKDKRRLPFYYRRPEIVSIDDKRKKIPQYRGHDLWGGQSPSSSKSEFRNAGEIALFCSDVDPFLRSGVAIPIAAERLLAIPTWPASGGTEWYDPVQYLHTFLDETGRSSGLAQAITFSHSDVRLTQLVTRICNSWSAEFKGIAELEQALVESIRFVYQTYDKPFTRGTALLLPGETLGLREIGAFLAELSASNHLAAEEIISEFERRSVGCLGALHGGDSHLGGIRDNNAGLMFGGPQSIRNIDLFGTMHDFDTNSFLPWSPETSCNGVRNITNYDRLQFLQAADALLLRESIYWFRAMMSGFNHSSELTLRRVPFDLKQDITVLTDNSDDSAHLTHSVQQLRNNITAEQVLRDEHLITIYQDYAAKGREVADQRLRYPV